MHCMASPTVSIPRQVVHWLQLMNLHWHVTITQGPGLGQGALSYTRGAWGKWTMTCVRYKGLPRTVSPPQKSSRSAYYSSLPQHLAPPDLFTVSTVVAFPEPCSCNQNKQSFPTGFSHLATCTEGSCTSFHGLIAHFLLALSNIPLSACTTVHPSPTEGRLGCFPAQAITQTAAIHIPVQVFVWT